jgi:putative molybdopterin biosynthesis protein
MLALEAGGLVVVQEIRRTGRVTEKFYRAKADAFLLQQVVLPASRRPVVVFSGSHDLAMEAAADRLARALTLLSMPVGSLDGLANLRQGLCQISGTHLRDDKGEYNTAFVHHLFPDRDMRIVTLAHRAQGLMMRTGNPLGIKSIGDLVRPRTRFVNRNAGSGTRVWFDGELKRLGISPKQVSGYDRLVDTHSAAARLVEVGKVDVAVGLQAAAHQYHLDFLPLLEERYDLAFSSDDSKQLAPLLDYVQTAAFRRVADGLTGYSTIHSGEQIQTQ